MKRIKDLLRATCLMLLLPLAFSIQAQTQFWAGGIRYEVTGRTTVSVIASNNGSYSGSISIPQTVMGQVYSNYDGNYMKNYQVTGIGNSAFRNCTGLTSIELPPSIKSIEYSAFYGCTGLTSIIIPNGVTYINSSAFAYCTALTSIELPNSVSSMSDNVFYGCSSLTSVKLSGNVSTLYGTFHSCTSLTTVEIPANVKKLDGTFQGCTNLREVTLPNSLTQILANTFDGCSSLQHIYLPNKVTDIGRRAFAETGLTSLELPASVTSLAKDAFYGSDQLQTVTVRNTNPPTMNNRGVFSDETYAAAFLYVPEVSVSSYQSASWWREFVNLVPQQELNHHYDFEEDGIYYLITGNNTVDVTYKDTNYNSYSGTVNVPATVVHNGVTYNVTGVGNYAFNRSTGLTGVTLPSSVTTIGDYAFSGCSGLNGFVIPESVTAIGDYALESCTGLTSLTIPLNVTNLGSNALAGIPLQSLTWNARECWNNGNLTTDALTQVNIGNQVTVLPNYFVSGAGISTVDLPLSLTKIGYYAFKGCSNLTSLTVPVNVTDIGSDAFRNSGITSLTWNARKCWSTGHYRRYYYSEDPYWFISDLTIGDEVEVLPDNFVYCGTITSLTIPESVQYIGMYAFCQCDGLTEIVIPDNVINIGDFAFSACTSVSRLVIGKNVADIGELAFAALSDNLDYTWNARHCECSGMGGDYYRVKHLTIGDEVEYLPWYFCSDADIQSLEIPASVRTIFGGAFSYCSSLTSVTIPEGVITIGNDAFHNCSRLENLTVSSTVRSIGSYAFTDCDALTSLTLNEGIDTIGDYAFHGCDALLNLHIPASVNLLGRDAFKRCYDLETITVAPANTVYDSRDNCNAILKTANDSIVLTCKNTVLPNTVTSIPDYAFYNNTEMTHMDIPASVTSIGKYAFYGCTKLQDITIPAAVTSIGECAFAKCPLLGSMVVENGNTVFDSRDNCNAIIETGSDKLIFGCKNSVIPATVAAIGSRAFYQCNLTGINIPGTVMTIGAEAFRECTALATVTLGSGVTTIDSYAFYCCYALTGLTIPNTVTSIGSYAFKDCSKMTSLTIPGSVKTINQSAFNGCTRLTSLSIGNGVETIGPWAFANCYGLTSLVIPASVTTIDTHAFYHCSGLTTVMIPASVTSIGEDAFFNCSALETVTCLVQTPPTINYWTFNPVYSTATLRVPLASLEAYQTADYWRDFANIVGIPGAGPGDVSGDGQISITDVTTMINAILSGDEDVLNNPYADVNGDGKINISDITTLITMLLSNSSGQ